MSTGFSGLNLERTTVCFKISSSAFAETREGLFPTSRTTWKPFGGVGGSGTNVIKAEPSKESTLRMMTWCMLDDGGDRDTSILAMPRIASHPWLKYWSGLG